jgi:hypothetical protein
MRATLSRLGISRWNGWLIILLPALIAVGVLLLTETTQAAAPVIEAKGLVSELLFQQSQPTCQTCHPDEHAAWQDTVHAKAALDPVFKEQFAKSHNQGDCLKCHTTGFDAASGKFTWEGVTCEACHGPYKEGHPAAQTMQLPMESDTCRVCHQAAFEEWDRSEHAKNNIECFDCHSAHTQGLRTGSAAKLCAACHNNEQTQFSHSIHGIGGVDCGNCHMVTAQKNSAGTAATGAEIEAKSHSFVVPTDVCNQCHSNTIHPTGGQLTASRVAPQMPSAATNTVAAGDAARVKELEAEATDLERRLTALRDTAVISMGIALGFGGFVGLMLGIAGMSLWHRSQTK